MSIEIYRVKLPHSGGLFVMPAPRMGPLEEFAKSVLAFGVDEVVSLLSAEDVEGLRLEGEQRACIDEGLAFTSFAIPDFGLPDPAAFAELAARLAGDLGAGRAIAVHCRAGVGRSGMLACCVLKHLGFSGEDAIARVSQARQHPVPDNVVQRNFILSYMPSDQSKDDGG